MALPAVREHPRCRLLHAVCEGRAPCVPAFVSGLRRGPPGQMLGAPPNDMEPFFPFAIRKLCPTGRDHDHLTCPVPVRRGHVIRVAAMCDNCAARAR